MNRKNVYIGVYKKDNHESLFYQEDYNLFYDLKQKRTVLSSELEDSLIPYSNIIEEKRKFKKDIIKLYDLDRIQKVSLNRVFIGNVYELENIVITNKYNFSLERLDVIRNGTARNKLIKENVLLLSTEPCDSFEDMVDLMDMETGIVYCGDFDLKNGIQYVPRVKNVFYRVKDVINIDEKNIEKGKLLEKYRAYKRG